MKHLLVILLFLATALFPTENKAEKNIETVSRYFISDGHYTKTGKTVLVYTESGHRKGFYDIYLHDGKKYIKFNSTWICIQGKRRFGYNGNWYIIK